MHTVTQTNLRQARELLGLTQKELGLALGWSDGRHISSIELGVRPLHTQTALAIECLLRREKKFDLLTDKACTD